MTVTVGTVTVTVGVWRADTNAIALAAWISISSLDLTSVATEVGRATAARAADATGAAVLVLTVTALFFFFWLAFFFCCVVATTECEGAEVLPGNSRLGGVGVSGSDGMRLDGADGNGGEGNDGRAMDAMVTAAATAAVLR